mgnify:CR=1 FL=1
MYPAAAAIAIRMAATSNEFTAVLYHPRLGIRPHLRLR